jgi:hypothetical protein
LWVFGLNWAFDSVDHHVYHPEDSMNGRKHKHPLAVGVLVVAYAATGLSAIGAMIECHCDAGHESVSVAAHTDHRCDGHHSDSSHSQDPTESPCEDQLVTLDGVTRPGIDRATLFLDATFMARLQVVSIPDRVSCPGHEHAQLSPPGDLALMLASTVLLT